MEVPKGPFVVRTRNSVYKFGQADKKGERTVERLSTNEVHTGQLGFTRCIVLYIVVGRCMELCCVDGPGDFRLHGWHSSTVQSVESD